VKLWDNSEFMSRPNDILNFAINASVSERIEHIDLPFGELGFDRFGISKRHLGLFYSLLEPLYRHYFKVEVSGIEHIPKTGRGMLIGNHSGGIPVDAGMLFASVFFELDPPRHAHGMVEKFAQNLPFLSPLFSRIGQFTGLPEHAIQILEAERLLLAFPEGVRGTGKLFSERYQLERFGTGFMRIALQTKSPIVPFAFVGGEEAMPVIYHAQPIADLIGVPYIPIPKHIIPVPKPEYCEILYGEPLYFEGSGNERDPIIQGYVDQVKQVIADLIVVGRQRREQRIKEALEQKSKGLTHGGKLSKFIRQNREKASPFSEGRSS
jgi:1-acyl-sn-glycerol-3-phosphate acyltransferase